MQDEDPYRFPSETELETRENPFRAVRQRTHGFRSWMAVNHDLAVVFCLIAAYASMIVYLIALMAFGRETLASRALAVLVVAFAVLAWTLVRLSLRRGRFKRTKSGWHWRVRPASVWALYRPVKTERVEQWIAAVLWLFIVVAVVLLLWHGRHPK